MKEYITPAVKMYEASLNPCPMCECAEQRVCGVLMDGGKWSWDVECAGCGLKTKYYGSEQEALHAWNKRHKQEVEQKHEIEQDGDITWGFYDLWVECAKRYAKECLGRRNGAD